MKARIKTTGEIVEVKFIERKTHTDEQVYMTNDGCLIEESRLDFNVDDTPDYWTRLEHTYAGMAMQGILSNQEYVHSLVQRVVSGEIHNLAEGITKYAEQLAHALVQKLKEKEERK